MNEETITDLKVEIHGLREYIKELQDTNRELQEDLNEASERADQESRRCSSITAGYSGMRTRLDMAFGAPDGEDRRERGRCAGLDGSVNYAIAEYARVMRENEEMRLRLPKN